MTTKTYTYCTGRNCDRKEKCKRFVLFDKMQKEPAELFLVCTYICIKAGHRQFIDYSQSKK